MLRFLCLAAGLLAGSAAASERWEPLQPEFGVGTAICHDGGDNTVCAVLMCEGGGMTFGIMGTGHGGAVPPMTGSVAVDGQRTSTRMTSQIVYDNLLHIRTPVSGKGPMFRQLKSGSQVAITTFPGKEPYLYSLRGSSAEFERVASRCR